MSVCQAPSQFSFRETFLDAAASFVAVMIVTYKLGFVTNPLVLLLYFQRGWRLPDTELNDLWFVASWCSEFHGWCLSDKSYESSSQICIWRLHWTHFDRIHSTTCWGLLWVSSLRRRANFSRTQTPRRSTGSESFTGLDASMMRWWLDRHWLIIKRSNSWHLFSKLLRLRILVYSMHVLVASLWKMSGNLFIAMTESDLWRFGKFVMKTFFVKSAKQEFCVGDIKLHLKSWRCLTRCVHCAVWPKTSNVWKKTALFFYWLPTVAPQL